MGCSVVADTFLFDASQRAADEPTANSPTKHAHAMAAADVCICLGSSGEPAAFHVTNMRLFALSTQRADARRTRSVVATFLQRCSTREKATEQKGDAHVLTAVDKQLPQTAAAHKKLTAQFATQLEPLDKKSFDAEEFVLEYIKKPLIDAQSVLFHLKQLQQFEKSGAYDINTPSDDDSADDEPKDLRNRRGAPKAAGAGLNAGGIDFFSGLTDDVPLNPSLGALKAADQAHDVADDDASDTDVAVAQRRSAEDRTNALIAAARIATTGDTDAATMPPSGDVGDGAASPGANPHTLLRLRQAPAAGRRYNAAGQPPPSPPRTPPPEGAVASAPPQVPRVTEADILRSVIGAMWPALRPLVAYIRTVGTDTAVATAVQGKSMLEELAAQQFDEGRFDEAATSEALIAVLQPLTHPGVVEALGAIEIVCDPVSRSEPTPMVEPIASPAVVHGRLQPA